MDFKSCQCLRTTGLCTLGTTVKGFWPPEYLDLLSDFSAKQPGGVQHHGSFYKCDLMLLATAATRLFVKLVLTFLPPGEDVSGGGVLVMFSGLEPQLEGDDPLILK